MALDTQQINELVRLRCEERLPQRDIAEQLGVGMYTVKKYWHFIPDEFRGQLPEVNQARLEAMWEARQVAKEQRVHTLSGCKCPGCGFVFSDENPRVQGGWCALCELQAHGIVVLYAEVQA